MFYIIAAVIVVTIVVVAMTIWRRRASEANSALERVDAYIESGRIQSRLADACDAR
jgi:hypothetical protein